MKGKGMEYTNSQMAEAISEYVHNRVYREVLVLREPDDADVNLLARGKWFTLIGFLVGEKGGEARDPHKITGADLLGDGGAQDGPLLEGFSQFFKF